ncbi:MAG: hypothetical protein ABIJ48_06155 [Actinomycetota bacterium]
MRWFSVGLQPVGVIAIGAAPTGIIAIGQVATGVVAVGQGARGVVAVGQASLGVFAFGQLAAGVAWAGGQLALGGTQGFAMLGFGLLGDWLPWRRGLPEIRAPRSTWTLALRAVLLTALAAAVAWFALAPIVDACLRPGGIFVPVSPLR